MTEDALFDAYLEACRTGAAEEPATYFARYPQIGPDVRASIEALHRAGSGRVPRQQFGEYDVVRQLDRGGMGLVYLARHRAVGRPVVLKVMRPELRSSETAMARFARESKAAAQLHHPHLVSVLDVGEQDDVAYFVMEYVPGRSLSEVCAERPRPNWRQFVRWGLQLARALAYAHGEGVIHRDVKPSNVRVDKAGAPKLIDFGIARTDGATQAALTTTFAGSPLYAAPEQLTGADLDGRADVYGLGATLYECVTGCPPFGGESLEQILAEVLAGDPLPPRRLAPGLPVEVESVLLRAIERDPQRRYGSAAAFADDLEALLDDRPVVARPPSAWRQLGRWGRRHPIRARASIAVAVLLMFAVGTFVWNATVRRRDSQAALEQAAARLQDYRDHVAATSALESKLGRLKERIRFEYLNDSEYELLDQNEIAVERRWRARDDMFVEVMGLIRRAERLDPEIVGADQLRAAMYIEKWHEARVRGDPMAGVFFREQAARLDPAVVTTERVKFQVTLETRPPGATVDWFIIREAKHERRAVPVPVAGTSSVAPGTRMTVNGRETGIPLLPTRDCRQGVTPLTLEYRGDDEYLVLLRLAGHEDVRVHLRSQTNVTPKFVVDMPRLGAGPAGCVYVVPQTEFGHVPSFWGMRHEVTAAQYREFLRATAGDAHVPRRRQNDPLWIQRDGAWTWPDDWDARWPILGVSWHDATAYATWRTAHDPKFRYTLPTIDEWKIMSGVRTYYVFGEHFRPRWVSSCYARPTANPVPVMSYPIDESVFGIYDLCGSASEWLDAWYDKPRRLRWLGGGSWGHSDPETFKVSAGRGFEAHVMSGDFGFRVIARRK